MLAMEMIGVAFISIILLMTILWVIYLFRKNSGIVDIGWAFGFVIIALEYAWMGNGHFIRKWLFCLMFVIWGTRLGLHLFRRLKSEEDPRYQALINAWGGNSAIKVFLMFLFQGFLVLLLAAPMFFVALDRTPGLGTLEICALVLWALAVLGETIADEQLERFKKYPGNQDKVCEEGWWFYSRHPNYFFEWLVWVAYFIFALSAPYGVISIYCPLLMLYLLLNVSGIPLTEKLALERKGETYRRYQERTSAFVPWFKKA